MPFRVYRSKGLRFDSDKGKCASKDRNRESLGDQQEQGYLLLRWHEIAWSQVSPIVLLCSSV